MIFTFGGDFSDPVTSATLGIVQVDIPMAFRDIEVS